MLGGTACRALGVDFGLVEIVGRCSGQVSRRGGGPFVRAGLGQAELGAGFSKMGQDGTLG
jgi:hypothetical protein